MGSLTQFQKSVIVGCVLGDGHVRTFPGRKNALLEINHSFGQKEYVDWKYSVLGGFVASAPKARKGNGRRVAYRFYTKQLPELTSLLHAFYGTGKKIIPRELQLDPVALAVWYMDDGSRCGTSSFYLNTQQYDLRDQHVLMEKLREMHLETRLNRDKEYWRIRFLMSSVSRLHTLISPYLIPSMQYKLSYNPVETSIVRSGVTV